MNAVVDPAPPSEASVVIVGAGYAGVSALHAALHYLEPGERALIADIRPDWGGNWRDQYDFVQLHQPYPMFTAYDQDWSLDADRSHLATRGEVVAHLTDLGQRAQERATVDTLFGHRYVRHDVIPGEDALNVVFEAVDTKRRVEVRAKRLIKPIGFNIPKKEPLAVSSREVESIAPSGLSESVGAGPAHYCVVGSGKTAMDAIGFIAREAPTAKVTLVSGNGMAFLRREDIAPTGALTRHVGGRTVLDVCMDCALTWDGTNHVELIRAGVRRGEIVSPVPDPYACFFGLLSQEELDTVQNTVSELIKGRMADVEDRDGRTVLRMQDDREIPLQRAPGQRLVVVGCTENLRVTEVEPILQCGGRVLAPQNALFFTGPSATVLTHAWYRGRLQGIAGDLRVPAPRSMSSEDKPLAFFAGSLSFLSNLLLLLDVLPASFFRKDKSSFQTWFPVHRQLLTAARLHRNRRLIKARCQALLGDSNLYPQDDVGLGAPRPPAAKPDVRLRAIEANGLNFRARTANLDAPNRRDGIIMLHGFPQTSVSWEPLMVAAARQGIPAVAFDQRGYSPGARLGAVDAYRLEHLVSDVFAVADAVGFDRFHVVGHDWGGLVAWQAAIERPSRLLSLASLCAPHPSAFKQAIEMDSAQRRSSSYIRLIQRGRVAERLLSMFGSAAGSAALRGLYAGLPAHHVEEYLRVLREPGALTAALNWYRAFPIGDSTLRPATVRVPVLFLRGTRDIYLRENAAKLQRAYVEADYRRVDLDVDHWLMESEPEAVIREVMAHWDAHGSTRASSHASATEATN